MYVYSACLFVSDKRQGLNRTDTIFLCELALPKERFMDAYNNNFLNESFENPQTNCKSAKTFYNWIMEEKMLQD